MSDETLRPGSIADGSATFSKESNPCSSEKSVKASTALSDEDLANIAGGIMSQDHVLPVPKNSKADKGRVMR